jgi:serine/threonine protein kinase
VGDEDATRTGEPRPPASAGLRFARGDVVDKFIVLEEVGAGGMGLVLAAYDPGLDRKVALKLHRAEQAGDVDRMRLEREAQAMARVVHPNVVTVYQAGIAGGQLFVAMELVDGGTLRAWLRARRRGWREVLDAFLQAGRGLAAAHRAGLVHRDFKPDNVLVGVDGRVRVTDFGLVAAPFTAPPADGGRSPRTSGLGVPPRTDALSSSIVVPEKGRSPRSAS